MIALLVSSLALQTVRYEMVTETIIPAHENMRIEWVFELEVTRTPEGWRYSRKTLANRVDGESLTITPGTQPFQWEAKARKGMGPDHGRAIPDYDELRLQRPLDFVFEPGANYKIQFPEVPVNRVPAATASYKLTKETDKAKFYDFAYVERGRERPMTFTGTVTTDLKGALETLRAEGINAPVPGSRELANVNLRLTRKKAP